MGVSWLMCRRCAVGHTARGTPPSTLQLLVKTILFATSVPQRGSAAKLSRRHPGRRGGCKHLFLHSITIKSKPCNIVFQKRYGFYNTFARFHFIVSYLTLSYLTSPSYLILSSDSEGEAACTGRGREGAHSVSPGERRLDDLRARTPRPCLRQ